MSGFIYCRLCPLGPWYDRLYLGAVAAMVHNTQVTKRSQTINVDRAIPDPEAQKIASIAPDPETLLRKALLAFGLAPRAD